MSSLGNKQIMSNNIRRLMKAANVTATDVCTTLKIPMPTFSDWINAKTYPRIDKIEMLANYFGVSKATLVEESDEYKTAPADKSAIQAAFWGGDKDLSQEDMDAMWSDVERFAAFLAEQKKREKGDLDK